MFLERPIEPEQAHAPQDPQTLPTMADLEALTAELDRIDETLAELQD